MAYNVKEIVANKPSRFTEGHRMCAGCGAPVVARHILRALKEEDHAVISTATGCMEVSTFIYPYTAWTDSFIHTAFENAGATCSGAEAAYKALKKQGKLTAKLATVMTDYAPHDQWLVFNKYVDYFFVSHEGMKKKLHEKNIPNEKIFATGIPLSNKFLLK